MVLRSYCGGRERGAGLRIKTDDLNLALSPRCRDCIAGNLEEKEKRGETLVYTSNSHATDKDPTPSSAINPAFYALCFSLYAYLRSSLHLSFLSRGSSVLMEKSQARETATEPPANKTTVNHNTHHKQRH